MVERDRRLADILELTGGPAWTKQGIQAGDSVPFRRRPGFEALLHIIVEQQLSVASANAIWARLAARVKPLTPPKVLAVRQTTLRKVGLSTQKIRYARALAQAVSRGELDLGALEDLSDEEASARLMELPGIGRWTAEIYLMFTLGRADVWPAGDLVLQNAARDLFGLEARPKVAEMDELAEPWRPWRSVAARLFWHYFEHFRGT